LPCNIKKGGYQWRSNAIGCRKVRKPQLYKENKRKTNMTTVNPLPEFNNENVLLTGTFEAEFTGCDAIERPQFENPSKMEQALKLFFEIPSEGVILVKIDGLRFGPKSNLRKDLRQMAGPRFSGDVFNNRDSLWLCIEELIGKRYTITCEPAESGAFTKITTITPARNGATASKNTLNGSRRGKESLSEINI
jgi:hypothetical protein